ncbi:MAG: RDD family protein, partial [Armatimonadetes bacterium]|nr:RDD family protein [Armatimonadota bacterium]
FFETLWSGRTPGKKILKLRVLKEGGQPIGFFDALLRNLIRFVDFLPFYYCAGILVMIFSPRNKRLGDWVAGTIVVREAQAAPSPLPLREPVGDAEFVPINEQEYQVIRRFLSRRNEIQPQDRTEICTRIAAPILSRAGIEGQDDDLESFLETIAGQYRETHKSL